MEKNSAPEVGLYCKPKYKAILFKIIKSFTPFYFVLVISAVGIGVPSIFCILKFLLIQVHLRWLVTVSSTFQDLEFDGPL